MSATAAVAVIGAISTPVVAFAGYLFNNSRARGDREAARTLASDTQEATRTLAADAHLHERELAQQAQAHERELRQSERAYDDRKIAYRTVLEWALIAVQQVQLTEPILRWEGMPAPPPPVSEDQWRKVQIESRLFGSTEVSAALTDFYAHVNDFNGRLMVWRTMVEQRGPAQQVGEAHQLSRRRVSRSVSRLIG
jgi:hypothetical protein